jgi:predicted RNA-binding protein YlqC (UPF0109 family)
MSETNEIPNLLLRTIQSLVDKPDEVSLSTVKQGETTVFRIRVASSDIGTIIGRQGRMAKSIRVVLGAIGTTAKRKLLLDIVEKPLESDARHHVSIAASRVSPRPVILPTKKVPEGSPFSSEGHPSQ